MKTNDLLYIYPESLIATAPKYPPRVLYSENSLVTEKNWSELLSHFQEGDLLVRNNTKVIPRRIFSQNSEILFLNENPENVWTVLFPAKKIKVGQIIDLPGGVTAELIEKGRPQKIKLSQAITSEYFFKYGELPLPPYIQKARGARNNIQEDQNWYQTSFAKEEGSLAAPTAGLHLRESDFEVLRLRGVQVIDITLHVGLGTFLPIQTETVEDFEIHSEQFEISLENYEKLWGAFEDGRNIITLGTTSTRVVETLSRFYLHSRARLPAIDDPKHFCEIQQNENAIFGSTRLFLYPGKEFYFVKTLMTNFHQPGSSLLALVCAFAGFQHVIDAYHLAIEKQFRLFSYGDLTVWKKPNISNL